MSALLPAQNAPVIIKKKKVYKAEEHHGGAWKVAYADFVTAMMAFFLLMWLLNATTEEQRKGIADYFNPTIPISRISGGGSDGLNGSSIFSEETYAKTGTGAKRKESVVAPHDSDQPADQRETKDISESLQTLKESLEQSERQLSEHLLIQMTPEGIVLEITDSDTRPLFEVGHSTPSPLLEELLAHVAQSFSKFENDLKIVGHTDNRPYQDQARYDNWNLSADRANTARRLLSAAGLDSGRIREVSGRADTAPLVEEDPSAAQNRRISITILTS